jgi:transcriptional regulator with XRE-family HTH domain
MDIRDVLALNLRKQRKAKGLSQEEPAHRADIDRTYISSLERSLYAAGIDVVDRLARAMGTEAADLLRRPTALVDGEKKNKALAARKGRKRV